MFCTYKKRFMINLTLLSISLGPTNFVSYNQWDQMDRLFAQYLAIA